MNEEQRIVFTQGLLLQARIRMEGMIAENQGRIHLGQQVAYQEDSFAILIDEYGVHHNALIANLRD